MLPVNKHPKWSGWQVVLVLAALFVMIPPAGLIQDFFTRVFLQSLGMAALVVFLTRRAGAAWDELGLHRHHLGKNILIGILSGLILAFVISLLVILMIYLTGRVPEQQEVARQLTGIPAGRQMLWPAIVVIFTAPVAEELFFRGMIYPLLRARWGVDAAVLISALFFSALHFSLYGLAPITIGGAVLAYLYQRTGSLAASIAAHGTWNGITILLTLFG